MLHTPIKQHHHHHPSTHAPAQQHSQSPQSRCSPQVVVQAHPHELNFADWLHMSPAQVAMMSPVAAAPYTPPNHHLFVPTPSPLQYSAVTTSVNGRNDFLATSSSLTYSSSPFQVPAPAASYPHLDPYASSTQYQQIQMHQVPTIAVSSENVELEQEQSMHMQDSLASSSSAHTGNGSGVSPSSPLNTDFFAYTSGHSQALSPSSASPISHGTSPFAYQGYARPLGEGESTPVTTISGVDESQANPSSQDNIASQPLIDRFRGVSPVTDAGSNAPGTPQRPANVQQKPIESIESPFRIAAPQPRTGSAPFSPMPPSSRPASALGALSELAELASRQPTPSQPLVHLVHSSVASPATQSRPSSRPVSRPASALSTRSTASHAKPHKVRRKQVPPHRFAPSILRVQLPYQSTNSGGENGKGIASSFIDGLARGPLEFEDDGHRYRTRSKLRSLKAEIQEREREADLLLIRRGLRGGGNAEDKSGLDMLASVSVTRRIELDLPKRSESPMSAHKAAGRTKKGTKRAFRDLEDADCESVTTASECGTRTPSKRQRVATEKAAQAVVKKEQVETRSLRSRASVSARPSPVRTSSQKGKRSVQATKSAKASPAPAAIKKTGAVPPKDHIEVDNGESELSSLSSMSETEDAKSEDTDYSPRKSSGRAGSRSTKAASASASASTAKAKGAVNKSSASCKAAGKAKVEPMSIDIERGAEAIPMPVRKFPSGVPIHASFPLLYRKFPIPAYTDPNFLEFAPFGGSSPLSPVTGSPALNENASSSSEIAGEGESALPSPPSGGHYNAPRGAEDLYTPRFVKGVGRDKMGLCPICYESPERGGTGRAEWLSMKFSAFNYHMQYAHGISPVTALPFSPPIAFRVISRTPNHKNEKTELLEGKCHRCLEWAAIEGVKCVEAKLKEIYWWKHAAQCHKGSTLPGEGDAHIEDDTAKRVRRVFEVIHARQHPTVPVLPKTCAGGPFISTPRV